MFSELYPSSAGSALIYFIYLKSNLDSFLLGILTNIQSVSSSDVRGKCWNKSIANSNYSCERLFLFIWRFLRFGAIFVVERSNGSILRNAYSVQHRSQHFKQQGLVLPDFSWTMIPTVSAQWLKMSKIGKKKRDTLVKKEKKIMTISHFLHLIFF